MTFPGGGSPVAPWMSGVTHLSWGLKTSFLTYVGRVPQSEVLVLGGADFDPTRHEFVFPAVDVAGGPEDARLRFAGELQIVAHAGLLRLALSDPMVVVDGAQATLVCTDRSNGAERAEVCAIGRAPWPPTLGDREWQAPLELAETGVHLFGDNYPAGEALAPLCLIVS